MATTQEQPRSEASQIAWFMGLRKWADMNDVKLVESVEAGLPISAAEKIVRRIDPHSAYLRVQDIIPRATFYRLKYGRKQLSKDQSEKVLALSKVFHETLRQYHGDTAAAAMFLSRGHPMLGGRSPLDMAKESTAGADLVLKLLTRAEAGVSA